MIRVVVDTNVVVSAILKENGPEAAALALIGSGRLVWYVSPPILDAFQLRRLAHAEWGRGVCPEFTLSESPDDPDNRFLECAEAVQAEYLITGNARHFPEQWLNTRILNARKLLGLVG